MSPSTSRELSEKLRRVRRFLSAHRLKGLLLSSRANFSWLTGGRSNHVRSDSEKGVASLWVSPTQAELWCNSIEEKRFQQEEAQGLPFTYRVYPWYEKFKPMLPKAASDDGAFGLPAFPEEIGQLRWALTPEEVGRYRLVGKLSGEAMEEVGKRLKRGWRENQVAAELSKELVIRGLEASVILVGSDERLRRFRHPIPTSNKITGTVMMVICAKGWGLIANLTRIVHFGSMPLSLRLRHLACLQVECAMWHQTLAGSVAKEVFQKGISEYAAQGYPGEWKKHHQGGPTGYDTRDYLATPDCAHRLVENQAIAWNPSITGTKSEDTVLLTKKGLELLTPTPHWPMVKVKFGGKNYNRPDILVKK